MVDWQKFKFPKPGPKKRSTVSRRRHRREQEVKRSQKAEVVAAVRAEIWPLDTRCALCGKVFSVSDDDEMHEIIPRSKTRGRPPEERFSRQNCIRLHRACHQAVTGVVGRERAWMVFVDPAQGIDGGVIVGYGEDTWWTYRRTTMGSTTTKPTTATVKKPMQPGKKKPAGQ